MNKKFIVSSLLWMGGLAINSQAQLSEEDVYLNDSFSISEPAIIPLQLPIEVLGAEGTTASRSFELTQDQLNAADKIFFYANNLGYNNKGSIQINDGSWVRLNPWEIDIHWKEARYGMSHGGMNSIRFTIPTTDLVEGNNTINFRFDTSDGISIGYRIFRFNLLDVNGDNILPDDFFAEENPDTWTAPTDFDSDADIAAGKELWYKGDLFNHYLPDGRAAKWYGIDKLPRRPIRATCADCHTQDGRDLEYFAYSNHAIIERSKFHGLSETEGSQIAAYIRSLDVPRHGRPWNPPYQPGPSVGEKPVEYWAAGAGIDAVLEQDKDMLPYMFTKGTSQAAIDDYFDSDKMHDTTTVPLALQFPDWKHWLPMVHPKDAYGDFYAIEREEGKFVAGYAAWHQSPFAQYYRLRWFLENNDHDALVAKKGEFYGYLGDFWKSFRKFYTQRIGKGAPGHWRTPNAAADKFLPQQRPGYGQMARTSLARLMAVKFFELHQEFKLEELNQRLIPAKDQPAPRQWLHAMGYNVFEVTPHFTAKAHQGKNASFHGQSWITGIYETTNWYELQMVVNPGNGRPGTVGPVDFNYHPGFIRKHSYWGRSDVMRYYRAMNNAYQVKTYSGDSWDYSNKKNGFYLKQLGPRNIAPWDAPNFRGFGFIYELEKVSPGNNLPVKVFNAMLTQMAVEMEKPQNHPDTYSRTEWGDWFSLEWKTRTHFRGGGGYADNLWRFFDRIKHSNMDLDPTRVNRVIDWCETAWPLMNWNYLRPYSSVKGTSAAEGTAYHANLADFITDIDLSTAQSIRKAHGRDSWVVVSEDGSLSGTPGNSDVGLTNFTVVIVDAQGNTHYRAVKVLVGGTKDNAAYLAHNSSGGHYLRAWGSAIDLVDKTLESTTEDDVVVGKREAWSLIPASEGYVYLQSRDSGKRLQAIDAKRVAMAVVGTEGAAAEWKVVKHNEEWSFIFNRAYKRKLHAAGSRGFKLDLGDASWGGLNVQWRIDTSRVENRWPRFTASVIGHAPIVEDQSFVSTLADSAVDADGDPLTFRKVSGPRWLTVDSDGTLSGTPGYDDIGQNIWVVSVSDGNGGSRNTRYSVRVKAAEVTNLALNKPVTVDSVSGSDEAARAVDGYNSGNGSRWVSAPDHTWPHWIEVDLQGSHEIRSLSFWTGWDGYNNPPTDFQFQYWDGSDWVNLVTETGNTDASYRASFKPVETTKVRLYGKAGQDDVLRLYEIEVYGR